MSPKVPSDLEIAQAAECKPIMEIADKVGLLQEELVPYGWQKAKVSLDVLERLADKPNGKYIDVTAITPTPLGEGKTTTTVGLTQGLGTAAFLSFLMNLCDKEHAATQYAILSALFAVTRDIGGAFTGRLDADDLTGSHREVDAVDGAVEETRDEVGLLDQRPAEPDHVDGAVAKQVFHHVSGPKSAG